MIDVIRAEGRRGPASLPRTGCEGVVLDVSRNRSPLYFGRLRQPRRGAAYRGGNRWPRPVGTLPVVDWRARVDRWWADVLCLPVQAIESGGLFALDHVDHVGVLEVAGRPPLLYAPPALLAALDGVPLSRDAALVAAAVDALAGRVTRVLGPAWYGYTTVNSLAEAGPAVRAPTPADLDALAELHRRTAPEQVDESGIDGLPAFGVFDGGRLVAVACLEAWHEMSTIGVLTHPAHRGRALARQVVAAASRAGLERRPEVQYGAWHENRASVAVGRACGFAHYGDGCVIDLADT